VIKAGARTVCRGRRSVERIQTRGTRSGRWWVALVVVLAAVDGVASVAARGRAAPLVGSVGRAHAIGSTVTAGGVCASSPEPAEDGSADGDTVLVPGQPVAAAVCRYRGLNDPSVRFVGELAGTATVTTPPMLSSLISRLDALQALPNSGVAISCPDDDAAQQTLTFTYSDGSTEVVTIAPGGCQSVSNGSLSVNAIQSPGLIRELDALTGCRTHGFCDEDGLPPAAVREHLEPPHESLIDLARHRSVALRVTSLSPGQLDASWQLTGIVPRSPASPNQIPAAHGQTTFELDGSAPTHTRTFTLETSPAARRALAHATSTTVLARAVFQTARTSSDRRGSRIVITKRFTLSRYPARPDDG
jgi:hypothetical protein